MITGKNSSLFNWKKKKCVAKEKNLNNCHAEIRF